MTSYSEKNSNTAIMLIGCGRHAFRNHLPVLMAKPEAWRRLVIVDLRRRIDEISTSILAQYPDIGGKVEYLAVDANPLDFPFNARQVPEDINGALQAAADKHGVNRVIVATDPEYHVAYACWALQNDFNVLMDKPISAPTDLRTSTESIDQIYADYMHIYEALKAARKRKPRLACSILAQRRHHIGFQKVLSLIEEISSDYGVGVTAFQSLHSDGQWRPPLEMISQDYHGYNRGYGKGMHSGYHGIDIVNYLVEESWRGNDLTPAVHADFVYPDDYLAAFPSGAQYKILGTPVDDAQQRHIHDELSGKNKLQYGEMSVNLSLGYKNKDGLKISAGTVSLMHDGVSQRHWASADGKELYKNGRVRHESHYFVSGPLQAIKVIAYESDEKNQSDGVGVGETYNFDIHVFRNHGVMKDSPAYQLIRIDELYEDIGEPLMDPLKNSRSRGIEDFFMCVETGRSSTLSDYMSHSSTMKLMADMYRSAYANSNN
ncbi:MAG: sle [Candidatus Saccharibacteria bacterium]|nr:sle [Candidatus Saccharibacteria bacterium]